MKKILAILIIILTSFNVAIAYSAESELPPYPVIESEAAVLMDAASGQVLFAKNMHEQLYPASITKIMTVLLGLENSSYNDTITMSREAVFSIGRGASHIALDVGEQITMEQALMAAILPSANEACNGIAEHIGGSIPEFTKMMNERAKQAGALHTNFTNANGLCEEDHVTTAYDMAMITKTALLNDQFRIIFGTPKYEIPPTNMQSEPRYLWAKHKMFAGGCYEYPGVIGGKTGYTDKSQSTLVTVAHRGDRELIVVVIKSQNSAVYTDSKALLDYGFNEFREERIILPSITADNLMGETNALAHIQQTVGNMEKINYTRLLHKSIDVDDIVVDYQAVHDSMQNNIQINANINLKKQSNLMYPNLGTIVLEYPEHSEKVLYSQLINFSEIILKIVVVVVVVLFALRGYIRRRNIRRRKLSNGWRKY